jgi:hypothetical protein
MANDPTTIGAATLYCGDCREEETEMTNYPLMVSMNAAQFDTLMDAVEDACQCATWYPCDEFGTAEMLIPASCIAALDAARAAIVDEIPGESADD